MFYNSTLGQVVRFNHITPDDGLSTGNVQKIIQDYQGFFWFGTDDGLHLYNGYTLNIYRHNLNDPQSISSNSITALFEDSKKNLWVGTMDGGLCLYDREKNKFIRFKHDPQSPSSLFGNQVKTIYESDNGLLFIGFEEGGMSYFQTSENINEKIKFTNFAIPNLDNSKGGKAVGAIAEGPGDAYLIGIVGRGLNEFNPKTKQFKQILEDSCSSQIKALLIDSKNRLWMGSWFQGLYVYDLETKVIVQHAAGRSPDKIQNNQIETIVEDHEGNIWIGTDNGLSLFKKDQDPFMDCKFITYKQNNLEKHSLLSNPIKSIYVDKYDRIWVGSYFGGVNIYDKNIKEFNTVYADLTEGSLTHDNVFAFAEDKQGNIWIGTDGGGLNFVEGGTKNIFSSNFKKIDLINDKGLKEEKIKCLEFDRDGILWIGTWGGGMFMLNPETGEQKQFTKHNESSHRLPADEVLVIKTDAENNLWIGTFGGGLTYYNRKNNVFQNHSNSSIIEEDVRYHKIFDIFIDQKGHVWVCKEGNGLSVYDPVLKTSKKIEVGDLTKDITVYAIHQDYKDALWLGTNIGLFKYHPEKNLLKHYNKENGLKSEVVHGIKEDPKTNHIWISSNEGLAVLDPQKEEFTNYNKADGLQGNQFNNGSTMVTKDGMFLFGGTKGFNAFFPENIKQTTATPPIVFTNFWLEYQKGNNSNSILTKNLTLIDTINLNYNQNSFNIEFAVLEYHFSRRNEYSYQLEGFNENWQYGGDNRKATFTNLNPGTYIFKVKATNSDGGWLKYQKSIVINIIPAWWQTLFFKVAFVALFILIAYIAYRLRTNYLIKQKRKLEKIVKTRTYELKLNNDKLAEKIKKIKQQNKILHNQKLEIDKMNNEILCQNKELFEQNEQIIQQQNNLQEAQELLEKINSQLEELVVQRTEKLEKTIQELDKTVFELDRFVYSASHDLSAPLKSILGLVQIAKMEKDQDQLKAYYNYMEASVRKLELVIKSMVEFSRNTHQDIVTLPFKMYELVDEVIFELRYSQEAQKIKFYNSINPDLEIKGDRDRVKVILHNLISNGIKYADFTKETPYIRVSCVPTGNTCKVSISDNGIGIGQDKLTKVFEMYYRGTQKSHGSGLGLYIVKEIAHKLHGNVTVNSKVGEQSEFIVELPTN